MHTEPTIPADHRDMTVAWLQSVLEFSGHEVEVAGVDLGPIGTGQMAESLRAELTYADPAADAPDSVVIKVASQDQNSRAAGAEGHYLKEVRFYQQLRADLDVCTPAMLFGDIDDDGESFVLVLEDLRPARQGDQIEGCSVEQARVAALNIAGLHGPSWRDQSLQQLAWLTTPQDHVADSHTLVKLVMVGLIDGFIDRYRGQINNVQVELLRWFAPRTEQWLELGLDRFALTHQDHRLDNLLFGTTRGGHAVATVDWQTIGLRNPLADVAYLLGTGLDVDSRRANEVDIVNEYWQRLAALGVDSYSAGQCYEDYCAQTFHALLIIVLGSMMTGRTERGDQMFMTMLNRSVRQIDDLDARTWLS